MTSTEEIVKRQYEKTENLRITKNVIILGLAFMIHFTAFYGTANIQSSVNADESLGTITLAVIYGSLMLSNIFLPITVIRWLGVKWTMAVSFIAYIPYIAAQFYPSFYTFIPTGVVVGLAGGPLWCAKSTYLSIVAEAKSLVIGNDTKAEVMVVTFFGIFFIFYQMAQVWGNLISSAVLSFATISTKSFSENVTSIFIAKNEFLKIENVGDICGANFCPGINANDNPNLTPPAPAKIQLLTSIFIACMVIAVLIILFGADSAERYGVHRKEAGKGQSGYNLLVVTLKLLLERYQLLLIPITMFIGYEQAYISVDFTASFVACGWGISQIGFTMICFGIANAIAAGIAGGLAKIVNRICIIITVFLLHTGLLIWMYQWRAVQNDYLTYCAMAALWGVCDGIWVVNINAFSGVLFPGKEIAAYANFGLWQSAGSVIGFLLSTLICTSTKLLILLVLLIIGAIGYGSIEYMEWKGKSINDRNNVELVSVSPKLS